MPAWGEDGHLYAVTKDEDGKRVNLCIMRAEQGPRGRKAYLLTDDGEDWVMKEIASGSDIDDVAREMGIAVTTLYTPNNRDKTKRAVEKGAGMVNNRLRKAQIRSALNGNATMLVWLGKTRLGQRDQPEPEPITVSPIGDFMRELSKAVKEAGDDA